MVKVREELPRLVDGQVDLKAWLDRASALYGGGSRKKLQDVVAYVARCGNQDLIQTSCSMADVLLTLKPDRHTLMATLLYPLCVQKGLSEVEARSCCGPQVSQLLKHLMDLRAKTQWAMNHNLDDRLHRDNLRKMLLALIEDARVVLIRLAEQVVLLREAQQHATPEACYQLAQATEAIHAPLAHRLGMGKLKWELEDFMFRFKDPEAYKKIARCLDEKRTMRDAYIDEVVRILEKALAEENIQAQISGRAKHIYSIWRKMQRKNVPFSDIYDIRAVRVLVDDPKECYTALSIVHHVWQYIPHEFDDYIAHPKANGYRSLHTAVMGADGRTLEVQIRTHQMHQEAELGVAAHWLYKEALQQDTYLQSRLVSLRQILDWQDHGGNTLELRSEEPWEDRIYVFTPEGQVLDLATGSTVLDFAYQVHTDLGHSCRGAKVNGKMVALNAQLHSGEQITIIRGKDIKPSRDWLNPQLGYVRTVRARNKILHWFRHMDRGNTHQVGRQLYDKETKRLGEAWDTQALAKHLRYAHSEALYEALGRGELRINQVISAGHHLHRGSQKPSHPFPTPPVAPRQNKKPHGDVTLYGIGNLNCRFALCCKPVPGDPIIGYVSAEREVCVHRQDCVKALLLGNEREERMLQISWERVTRHTYPVDIKVLSYDRQGLLSDITAIFVQEKVNISSMHTENQKDGTALMRVRMQVADLTDLGRVLTRIMRLPNIIEARRVKMDP